jgi:hypothetical protein
MALAELSVAVSVRAELACAQLRALAEHCAAIDAQRPMWERNIHRHALEALIEIELKVNRARAELGLRDWQVIRIEVSVARQGMTAEFNSDSIHAASTRGIGGIAGLP